MTSVSFSPCSGALAGNPLEIDRELLRSGKCLPMTEAQVYSQYLGAGETLTHCPDVILDVLQHLNMGMESNKLKKKLV